MEYGMQLTGLPRTNNVVWTRTGQPSKTHGQTSAHNGKEICVEKTKLMTSGIQGLVEVNREKTVPLLTELLWLEYAQKRHSDSIRLDCLERQPVQNVLLLPFIIGLCILRMTRTCQRLPVWYVHRVQDVVTPRFKCCLCKCMSKINVFFDQLKHCNYRYYARPMHRIVYVNVLLVL